MQLACSSAMLDDAFRRAEITQLEWVDLAARSLPVAALVFDVRHFPRTDVEYVAEIRKLCVDRSLTIAALAVRDLFALDADALEAAFALAVCLGAPLILTDAPAGSDAVPAFAWREAAQHGKIAARLAKRLNVTIAVRNAAGTLCASAAELKRLTKDIDSSWVRFAPDAATLSGDDLITLRTRSVLLVVSDLSVPRIDHDRKGYLVIEAPVTGLDPAGLTATLKAYAQAWQAAPPVQELLTPAH